MAGTPEVAQPEVEEPAALAGQLLGLVGGGERADGLEQVAAEDDRHAPLVQPLLRLVAGVAHGGIGMDLAHEGATAVCTDELGPGQLEREEGPREGGWCGDGLGDERIGAGDGRIGLFGDRCDAGVRVVVEHRPHRSGRLVRRPARDLLEQPSVAVGIAERAVRAEVLA